MYVETASASAVSPTSRKRLEQAEALAKSVGQTQLEKSLQESKAELILTLPAPHPDHILANLLNRYYKNYNSLNKGRASPHKCNILNWITYGGCGLKF